MELKMKTRRLHFPLIRPVGAAARGPSEGPNRRLENIKEGEGERRGKRGELRVDRHGYLLLPRLVVLAVPADPIAYQVPGIFGGPDFAGRVME